MTDTTDTTTSEDEGPVRSVRTPIGIDYTWSAGPAVTSYLEGLIEGRLVARRCDSCQQVYFPPRGACPTCAVMLGDDVELADRGTITSFCIVNVPFLGQKIKIPYVAAAIVLDGSDIAFQHLILGCEAHEVRMGMRVEAVWKDRSEWGPSLENIEHFRPSGEPDAEFETYARHL